MNKKQNKWIKSKVNELKDSGIFINFKFGKFKYYKSWFIKKLIKIKINKTCSAFI